jgi:DNA-binding XRE family transcriptional regulator
MAPKRSQLAQRRRAIGHTQESLAEKLQVDRTTVVRWERGDCEPQPWIRRLLAAALDVSLDRLATLLVPAEPPTILDTAPPFPDTVTAGIDDGGDPTDRRTFAISAALTGLRLSDTFEGMLDAPEAPASLSASHVVVASSFVDRFERADAATGGGTYCDVGIALHERLAAWERRSSYSRSIGDQLQAVLGELECWIGWLALDAERRSTSRRFLQDAIVRARLQDDPQLEVHAMVYLSLLIRPAHPRESLQCAEAAMRISAPWAPPRLTALLHLRAAHALSEMHDAPGFTRHLTTAKMRLDDGMTDNDPIYLHFATPTELTGIEGLAMLSLDRPDSATRAFRHITDQPDPAYRRNHTYYSVHLAEALLRQGDITDACAVGLAAVPNVAGLRSARTQHSLATLRAQLGRHASRSAVARDFVAAYDMAIAA